MEVGSGVVEGSGVAVTEVVGASVSCGVAVGDAGVAQAPRIILAKVSKIVPREMYFAELQTFMLKVYTNRQP